jgi:MFS family permease
LTCTFVCLIFQFYASFITIALKNEKGVNEYYHGFILSVDSITYLISTLLVGFVSNKLPKRFLILISLGMCVISLFLMGPSYYLGLPNLLWIMIAGLALQGASLGFVFIPILPEIIESLYQK